MTVIKLLEQSSIFILAGISGLVGLLCIIMFFPIFILFVGVRNIVNGVA